MSLGTTAGQPLPRLPVDFAVRFLAVGGGGATDEDEGAQEPTAEEQFSRACTVSFSYAGTRNAPLEKLRGFCSSSTDSPVECKSVVVEGLVEAIKESNGVGGNNAIPRWCTSVYGWFQRKYGQHCLSQCLKTQCVSTCKWMKEKERLEKVDINVYEKELKIKADEKALRKDRHEFEVSQEWLEKVRRTNATAYRKVSSAQEMFETATERLGNSTLRARQASEKLSKMEEDLRKMARNVSSREMDLENARHAWDMQGQKVVNSDKVAATYANKLAKLNETRGQLQEAKMVKSREIDAIKKLIADDRGVIEKMKADIKEHDQKVEPVNRSVIADEAELKAKRAAGTEPAKMLDILAKTIARNRQRLQKLAAEGRDKRHVLDKVQQAVTRSDAKVAKMEAEVAQTAEINKLSEEMQGVTLKQMSEQGTLREARKVLNETAAAMASAEAALAAAKEQQAKTERTLPFLQGDKAERDKEVRSLTEKYEEAKADLEALEDYLAVTNEKATKVSAETGAAEARIAKTADQLNATTVDVAHERAEVDDARYAHDRKKPFIVRHHEMARDVEHSQKRNEVQRASWK